MRIIKPSYEILRLNPEDIQVIEEAARTCYKSEQAMKEGSAEKLISFLLDRGHEAMIEHAGMTVKFIVDRGISHEIVRHRMCSFAQESTRYCNYSNDKFGRQITVIDPCFFKDIPDARKAGIMDFLDGVIKELPIEMTDRDRAFADWYVACENAESAYFNMLDEGCTPQEARSVLPNSLKTEVVVTANFREWRHIFELRTAKDAHPQIREVMIPLLAEMQKRLPVLFYDISYSS